MANKQHTENAKHNTETTRGKYEAHTEKIHKTQHTHTTPLQNTD